MSFPEKPIWALLKNKNVTIMLQQEKSFLEEYPHLSNRKTGGKLSLYIKVKEIDKFFDKIKNKIKIIKKLHLTPYNMKEFAIEDLDGYLLVFSEEK